MSPFFMKLLDNPMLAESLISAYDALFETQTISQLFKQKRGQDEEAAKLRFMKDIVREAIKEINRPAYDGADDDDVIDLGFLIDHKKHGAMFLNWITYQVYATDDNDLLAAAWNEYIDLVKTSHNAKDRLTKINHENNHWEVLRLEDEIAEKKEQMLRLETNFKDVDDQGDLDNNPEYLRYKDDIVAIQQDLFDKKYDTPIGETKDGFRKEYAHVVNSIKHHIEKIFYTNLSNYDINPWGLLHDGSAVIDEDRWGYFTDDVMQEVTSHTEEEHGYLFLHEFLHGVANIPNGMVMNPGEEGQREVFDINNFKKPDFSIENLIYEAERYFSNHFTVILDRYEQEENDNNSFIDARKAIEFDDGFYWADTGVAACPVEGRKSGHCGNAYGPDKEPSDILWSLRRYNGDDIEPDLDKIESHLTFIINSTDVIDRKNVLKQAKGHGNSKPAEKYHPYIMKLLLTKENEKWIVDVINNELYHAPDSNFNVRDLSESNQAIIKKNRPELFKSISDYR